MILVYKFSYVLQNWLSLETTGIKLYQKLFDSNSIVYKGVLDTAPAPQKTQPCLEANQLPPPKNESLIPISNLNDIVLFLKRETGHVA